MTRACTLGVVAVGLLLARPAFGQKFPLEVGPTVGLNDATVRGSGTAVYGASSRTGFELGVAATHPLSDRLGLEAALLYSTKGTSYFHGQGLTVTSSYIEVPLRVSYTLPLQGSRLMPRLVAGPYVGLETGCQVRGSSGGSTQTVNCSQTLTNNTFDLGVGLGAGLGLPVGRSTFDFMFRYDIGLTNIWSGYDAKNRVFGISAAYLMPLGKSR